MKSLFRMLCLYMLKLYNVVLVFRVELDEMGQSDIAVRLSGSLAYVLKIIA